MKRDIPIMAGMSKEINCLCDMCFNGGRVIKLSLPETKYHDGKRVSTVYHNIWICELCRDKLAEAIALPFPP